MAFKYHATYKWNSKPKYIWSNIEDFFFWIKWFIQRGWRGWADCDTWGMDGYLIEVMLPMLKHLKKIKHGYPCSCTEKGWDKIMDKMISGLEAGDRFIEDNYLEEIQPHWCDTIKGESIEDQFNRHPIKKESWGKYNKMSKEDEKEFHKAMELINKFFFALWD